MSFVAAKGAEPLVFGGRIRVHNLNPVELGGLLRALTFGGRADTHRHMMGRAKPYGYGQRRVAVQSLRIDDGRELDVAERGRHLQEFAGYMKRRIENWAEHDPIRQLISSADPAIGAELLKNLAYPGDYERYASIRSSGGRLARYPDLVRC